MRILHVYAGNLFGGVETYLVTLAKFAQLCPEMVSEFALCFTGRLSEELEVQGAKVHSLGSVRVRHPWTVLRARRALKSLLQQQIFEVVICHSPWSLAIFGSTIQRASIPLVFYVHGTVTGKHWVERWAKRIVPDYVICNSHFTEKSVASFYPSARRSVLSFPVAAPPGFSGQERLAIRSELGTAADAIVLIQVSRMESWKGHEVLLKSLGRMKDIPTWVCWIVGGAQRQPEEQYLASLRSLATEEGIAGRVLFLGQRSDVSQLLAAADIFVQPNIAPEPFGIVFVEALYAGLPVVTSNFGGGCEIVDDSCGVLVPALDVSALADTLGKLIHSPETRAAMGIAGNNRAHQMADPYTQLGKLQDLLWINLPAR